jgi:hypothetical protein
MNIYDTREGARLAMGREGKGHWNRWGPFLSERAWGTVHGTIAPMAGCRITSRTVMPVPGPTVGTRMGWPRFVIDTSIFVLRWDLGTGATTA